MGRVKHKEDEFYTLLKQFSAKIVEAADKYGPIVYDYPQRVDEADEMKLLETQADEIVHQSLEKLAVSFITPFDREDLNELFKGMDEIIDGMEGVAARLRLFHPSHLRDEAVSLTELTIKAVHELDQALQAFPEFKHDANAVMVHVSEILKLEDAGDIVYRGALGVLFDDEAHAREVLKWFELLDRMERTLDACKDVANMLQGVIMKNA